MAFLEPGHSGTQLNDLTGKFVTRDQGEPWSEFTVVNMEVCAADTASVNPQQDFIGLDFGQRDIAVFKLKRSVVNNGFHTRES